MVAEVDRNKQQQDVEWVLGHLKTLITAQDADKNRAERMLQLIQKMSEELAEIKEGKTAELAKRKKLAKEQKEREDKEKEDKERKGKEEHHEAKELKFVANPLRAMMEEQSTRKGTWALYEHMKLGVQMMNQSGELSQPQQQPGEPSQKTEDEGSLSEGFGLSTLPHMSSDSPKPKRPLRESRRLSLGELRSNASDSIRDDTSVGVHHHKEDGVVTSFDDFEVDALDESAMLDIEKRFRGLLLPRGKGLAMIKGKPKTPAGGLAVNSNNNANSNSNTHHTNPNANNNTPLVPSPGNSRLFSPGNFRRLTKR